MFRSMGAPEFLILLVILLLLFGVFGSKRLPDAARSVGRSMRIFKSEVKEMRKDDHDATVPPAGAEASRGPEQSRAAELEGRIVDPRDTGHRVTEAPRREQ